MREPTAVIRIQPALKHLRERTVSGLLVAVVLIVGGVGRGSTEVAVSSVHHRNCPHVDERNAPSPDPTTRNTLVPGRPYAVLVCRYWGRQDQGPGQTFAGRRYVTDARKIASFVQKLDALKPPRRERRPPPRFFCGEDRVFGGRSIFLLFRYTNAPDDPVRITVTNCIPASNGHERAFRFAGSLELGEHWPDEGVL